MGSNQHNDMQQHEATQRMNQYEAASFYHLSNLNLPSSHFVKTIQQLMTHAHLMFVADENSHKPEQTETDLSWYSDILT